MKALVFATGVTPETPSLQERFPALILPLLDRPFIQHVTEYLIELGTTHFDFVLSHHPEMIEAFLGDGTRWGSHFTFHLVRDPICPYNRLSQLAPKNDEPFLLVHADRLPATALPHTFEPSDRPSMPTVYRWAEMSEEATEPVHHWTGWAWLTSAHLQDLDRGVNAHELGSYLIARARTSGTLTDLPRPLCTSSYDDILYAHRILLSQSQPDGLRSGREVEAGVWLSRNVSLHPTAQLTPPVYIGENCQIGKGVQLGPWATINQNCVVDSHSMVSNAVIFPGSYVGEALELSDVVVDKNRLVNVRMGVEVPIADDFLLGSLSDERMRDRLFKPFSQVIAGIALLAGWPILLATVLWLKLTRPGPVWHRHPAVALPAPNSPASWQTFHLLSFAPHSPVRNPSIADLLLHVLPGLINVAKGDTRLVGVRPRLPDEIWTLSEDWRALYLQTKSGLITEADVQYETAPNEDELYMAEAYYAVRASIRYDVRLLVKYVQRMMRLRVRNDQ